MKIAIIGGGAAGMTAAYLLDKAHNITLFEKQPILGGNIRTLNKNVTDVALDPTITLDNGVIEFQTDHFIYFHKLMHKLGVSIADVDGGSSALYLSNGKQISGPGVIRHSGLNGGEKLRAHAKLLPIMLSYLRFLQRTRSSQSSSDILRNQPISNFWAGDTWHMWQKMLLMYGYSIPYNQLDDFPAEVAVEILRNSGYGTRWTRIVGGVYTYIEKILADFSGEIRVGAQITAITRHADNVDITLATGESAQFDKIIFAMPPDQVLTMLADPTEAETRRFGEWRASQATTLIHTDTSFYEPYGVNYYSEFDLFEKNSEKTREKMQGRDAGYNAYLNRLCGLSSSAPHYSLAYNLTEWIDTERIIHRQQHHTPLYSTAALRYRHEVIATNGERNTYHAGAYLGNGLHEGAIQSANTVARLLGGDTLD